MVKSVLFQIIVLTTFGFVISEQLDEEDDREFLTSYFDHMKSIMNPMIDPCEDFYEYACGNYWELYPVESELGRSSGLNQAAKTNSKYIGELLETDDADDTNEIKMTKRFYRSCMNTDFYNKKTANIIDIINNLGGCPLLNSDNWKAENFSWIDVIGKLAENHFYVFLKPIVKEEELSIKRAVPLLTGNALNLPYSKEYLGNKTYLMRIMDYYGVDYKKASKTFSDMIELLKKLERDDRNLLDRDIYYDSFENFQKYIPGIDWSRYLRIPSENASNTMVLMVDGVFVKNLIKVLSETKPDVIANYIMLNLISSVHLEFKKKIDKLSFCADVVQRFLPVPVSIIFVKAKDNDLITSDILNLTEAIREEFLQKLILNTWLDQATKDVAVLKLNRMNLTIVTYNLIQDKLNSIQWDEKVYNRIMNISDNFYENILLLYIFLAPSDHGITAPNAVYLSIANVFILFPGILTPPFYHRSFKKFMKYAGIGVVIGHEITHALDDTGILYDESGHRRNWWKFATKQKFQKRTECLVSQYDRYRIDELGEKMHGEQTLGENIADNEAIQLAYNSYKIWLERNQHYPETAATERIPGFNFTNMQSFFLSFAQTWCEDSTRKALKLSVDADVHSLHKFRVIGSLSNFNKFAEEFNCPLGSRMNPRRKCKIW